MHRSQVLSPVPYPPLSRAQTALRHIVIWEVILSVMGGVMVFIMWASGELMIQA